MTFVILMNFRTCFKELKVELKVTKATEGTSEENLEPAHRAAEPHSWTVAMATRWTHTRDSQRSRVLLRRRDISRR